MEERTLNRYYESSNIPPTEEELFQLNAYPLLDKREMMGLFNNDECLCQELFLEAEHHLLNAELELIHAYENKDWKKIQALAEREQDGTLYIGAIRLRYACQFLERYCEAKTKQNILEALFEQALNVLAQTRKALKFF